MMPTPADIRAAGDCHGCGGADTRMFRGALTVCPLCNPYHYGGACLVLHAGDVATALIERRSDVDCSNYEEG